MAKKNALIVELMNTYMYNEMGTNLPQYKVDQFNDKLRQFLEKRTLDELEGNKTDWLHDTVEAMWQDFCDNEEESEMKNYTYSDYTLFATGDSYGNYLVLEEDDSYNHLVFKCDPSDTETSAIANKFYTVGLTDDDFCAHDWEETDFRENSNGFLKVKFPVLKVYVNEASDITIVLHMGEDDNIWSYFDDEDAVQFLISYFEGNGKWDMEDFEHPLGLWGSKKYFMDDEMEEIVNGLTLVGENGIISDEVNEDWPVFEVLRRAGFCYETEKRATVHGRVK